MKFYGVCSILFFAASCALASPSQISSDAPFGSKRWTLRDAGSCPVDYRVPSASDWSELSSNLSGSRQKSSRAQFANGKSVRYFKVDSSDKVAEFNPKTAKVKMVSLPKKKNLETRCVRDRDYLAELGVENGSYFDGRNGRNYPVRVLGGKVWLAKNLAIDLNDNGKAASSASVSPSGCYLELQESCENFGRYYTWKEAQMVCPVGWHLPGDAEWRDFQKALSKEDWKNLGRGGLRDWDSYGDTSNTGYYWSSSSVAKGTARGWEFKKSRSVDRDDYIPTTGMYVRCVADLR